MDEKYSQIPIRYLLPFFEKWTKTLINKEVMNVFFIPKGDWLFRSWQYRDWIKAKHKIQTEIIDIEVENITTPLGLKSRLGSIVKKNEILLLARKVFFGPDANSFARVIEEEYANGRGVVIFHEGFPSELRKVVVVPAMHQHESRMGVYPQEVIAEYAINVAQQWDMNIEDNTIKMVIGICSGFPWLVNEALRQIKDHLNIIDGLNIESESFSWKVEQIFRSLPLQFQMVLMSSDRSTESSVYSELQDFGLIDKHGNLVSCMQKWIETFKKNNITINDVSLVMGNQDYGMFFSDSERKILAYFSAHKNEQISREQIAKIFWGTHWEDNFSDWSLDQVISRLRKKLKEKNIPIIIITKKGFGYVCR